MTTEITTSMTLGDIVSQHPELARELEHRSLDYCCGGRRTLAEACQAKGLDADETLAELSEVGTGEPAPWADLGPVELVDHLELLHHTYLKSEMPRLSELAAKVASVHGQRRPELIEVQQVYESLRDELDPHLMKEEQVLFPMIRELVESSDEAPAFHCGSLQNPISVMLMEHDAAGELLERLRELTSDYTLPPDACGSYTALYKGLEELEADTHLHIHKENNILFPTVVELETQGAG